MKRAFWNLHFTNKSGEKGEVIIQNFLQRPDGTNRVSWRLLTEETISEKFKETRFEYKLETVAKGVIQSSKIQYTAVVGWRQF